MIMAMGYGLWAMGYGLWAMGYDCSSSHLVSTKASSTGVSKE
ncbi:MAG: hypothetical protein V3U87_07510 [Methylococcaceae bacterium]